MKPNKKPIFYCRFNDVRNPGRKRQIEEFIISSYFIAGVRLKRMRHRRDGVNGSCPTNCVCDIR